jgi:hypothetical protein
MRGRVYGRKKPSAFGYDHCAETEFGLFVQSIP